MTKINNPILRGFNPDPSICRVDGNYYIATSTFEWLPAIAIHRSSDLVSWDLTDHVFTDHVPFDLRGVIDSAGIWAPSLSYHDGLFYMVYTVVRTRVGAFKDVHNYVVTSRSIHGPWSEPVYLNSSGFDPSLFHDSDGRKWVVNMQWDHRPHRPSFAGIVMQELDLSQGKLIGPIHKLLEKDVLIEGPNLYHHEGYYYLLLAEGGTGWNHGISMARSRNVIGPYEVDPCEAVMTTRHAPEHPLQKAGHGELVLAHDGQWYMVHLCSRPVGEQRRCILGRETAIQKVYWTDDGWLRMEGDGILPALDVNVSMQTVSQSVVSFDGFSDDFQKPVLDRRWSTLRVPVDDSWLWFSSSQPRRRLCLRGRESTQSVFDMSLIATRLTDVNCTARVVMHADPQTWKQMAGLIAWYNTSTHYFLRLTHDEKCGKVLSVSLSDDGKYDEFAENMVLVNDWEQYHLCAVFSGEKLQFYASPDASGWQQVGPLLDATKLSDDYGSGLRFTGAFVGLCAVDLDRQQLIAGFDHFELINTASATEVVGDVTKESYRDS